MRKKLPNKFSIYKITNTVNGKCYIGQTTQNPPETRWRGHLNTATYDTTSKKNNLPLYHAIRKYGEEKLTFEVIAETTNIDNLNLLEVELIQEYNSRIPNGYNVLLGGKNSPLPEDVKAKMSIAATGRVHTEESKAKMSISAKKRPPSNLGKKLSPEWCENMGKSKRLFDEETDKIIAEKYKNNIDLTVQDLAKEYNCSCTAINNVLGRQNCAIRPRAIIINQEQELLIVDKYKNGLSMRKIGREFGIDWDRIKEILVKHNISIKVSGPNSKIPDAIISEVRIKIKNGENLNDLSKEYKINIGTMRAIRRGAR